MDIGVSDLVSLLDTYDSEEVPLTREYLIMLWQMLQDELEQAVGDEATAVAEANKKMREDAFDEFIEKKIEALESSRKKGIFNKILKWAGVVAAVIGAAVSYVVSAAAILTGVGAGAGVALCVGATIMIALAVAGTISAGLDEAGKNWQLGSLLGQGIVKALNSMGANIDEEQFANWFAFAVQMTLTIVAVVCTLGGSMASAAGAAASAGTSAAKTAGSVATAASKVTSALDKTKTILNALDIITSIGKGALEVATGVITLQDAYTQADFVKIKALLEKLSDIQNMEQELAAQIFQMIFDNMRANVSNATDTILQDMEMMSGLNLNRA